MGGRRFSAPRSWATVTSWLGSSRLKPTSTRGISEGTPSRARLKRVPAWTQVAPLTSARSGATALHWAAHNGHIESAAALLKAHADVNARNDFGCGPNPVSFSTVLRRSLGVGSCAGRRETAEGEARRFGTAAEYADAMRLVRPHSMSAEGALSAFFHSGSFLLLLLDFCNLSCCRLSSGSKRRSVRFGRPLSSIGP